MASEVVSSVRITDLIDQLRTGEYLVPQFQREFVWSIPDVIALLNSIIDARPIGMLTVWEQPDDSGLDLEHISVPDGSAADETGRVAYFGDLSEKPKKFFAVLDGRQRCTAIAMAFGGLSAKDSRRKHSGKFFLNIAAQEPVDRIVFKKNGEIEKERLDILVNCISSGLLPFEMDIKNFEDLDKQWMSYNRRITDPTYYKENMLPNEDEMERRISVFDNAFNGIIDTTLAVYAVPRKYDLGTICEIFETLNTTGTRVSTVDLIHSWLYADTQADARPVLLRDWVNDLGQIDGALGWASADDRPELIAQFVTACHLAEVTPPTARKVGGKIHSINSVKSGDLLATPSQHWQNVMAQTEQFASYIGGFQKCVSGSYFTLHECPYPISAAIYVGLRWSKKADSRSWAPDDLDSVFRAFFWRNALSSRYDQGFLTKMSSDMKLISQVLDKRDEFSAYGDWMEFVNSRLDVEVTEAPAPDYLTKRLLEPKPTGALAKALMLL
jgi:hypothetical protein